MEQAQSSIAPSLLAAFSELGQKAWQPWLMLGRPEQHGELLEEFAGAVRSNLDASERIVNDVLRSQSDWLEVYREAAGNGGLMGPSGKALAETGVAALEQLLETKALLWERWFDALRKAEIRSFDVVPNDETPSAGLLAMWQNMSRQMLDAQAKWLEPLVTEQAAANPEVGEVAAAAPKAAKRQSREGARKTA